MNEPADTATTFELLARALVERRPVRARYHGHDRVLCPHLLGWKNGRAKLLAYQSAGATSTGALPVKPEQRWRSLFLDEIKDAVITADLSWESCENYSPVATNCVDRVAFVLPATDDA
jgi:hypothetical protein